MLFLLPTAVQMSTVTLFLLGARTDPPHVFDLALDRDAKKPKRGRSIFPFKSAIAIGIVPNARLKS